MEPGDAGPALDVVVSHVEALGNENLVHAWVAGTEPDAKPMILRAPRRVLPRSDERLRVAVDTTQLLLFDKATELRVPLSGPVVPVDDRQVAG